MLTTPTLLLAWRSLPSDTEPWLSTPIPSQPPEAGKFLLYASHNGFGNQYKALRKGLLLAYVLRRTLVLPPLLRHYDLECGEICCKPHVAARLRNAAPLLYAKRNSDAAHESLLRVFNLSSPLLTDVGVHVIDYPQYVRASSPAGGDGQPGGGDWRAGGVHEVPLKCKDTAQWSSADFARELGARSGRNERLLQLGSLYWFGVQRLLQDEPQLASLWRRLRVLPLAAPLRAVADRGASRLPEGGYASAHVRSLGWGDSSSLGEVIALWTAVEIDHARRANATGTAALTSPSQLVPLFVATDLRAGTADPLLRPLVSSGRFAARDLRSLELGGSAEWRALRSGEGGLSEGAASMMADVAMCVHSRAFFSPSMRGAPTNQLLRRSSFSEYIQDAWELEHGATMRARAGSEHGIGNFLKSMAPWVETLELNVSAPLREALRQAGQVARGRRGDGRRNE